MISLENIGVQELTSIEAKETSGGWAFLVGFIIGTIWAILAK